MQIRKEEDVIEEFKSGDAKEHQWLLILARSVEVMNQKFVFYPCDSYDRLADFMAKIPIVDATKGQVGPRDIPDDTVWVEHSSSEEDEDEDMEYTTPSNEHPHYVGKALFNTASTSHEALIAEGSTGWKLAMQQKYQNLQAKSQKEDAEEDTNKKNDPNDPQHLTAVKTGAAALIGSSVAVGGTSATVTGLGFTASGISANSMAAAIMASEAVASGGGVAAGGVTATLQSVGAVGVMASPIGMGVLAAGALLGGATYLAFHKRNQAKKEQDNAEEDDTKVIAGGIEYKKLQTEEVKVECYVNAWVIVSIQKQERDTVELDFTHRSLQHRLEAEKCFLERSTNSVAKGLFNPCGILIKSDADNSHDDGLQTALALHYEFVVSQGLVAQFPHIDEHITESTPLLKDAQE